MGLGSLMDLNWVLIQLLIFNFLCFKGFISIKWVFKLYISTLSQNPNKYKNRFMILGYIINWVQRDQKNLKGKFEKNKTIEQLFTQNKLRENLIPKISVRTSKPMFGKSRCY